MLRIFWRPLAIACCLSAVAWFEAYYSFSQEGWMVLAAFFACMGTRGTPGRQALVAFLMIAFATMFVHWLPTVIPLPAQLFILGIIFIIVAVTQELGSLSRSVYFSQFVFLSTVLLAFLGIMNTHAGIANQMLDVLLGLLWGWMGLLVAEHSSTSKRFISGVSKMLSSLSAYTDELNQVIAQASYTELALKNSKIRLEAMSVEQSYPEWIYEPGFNLYLRTGFRFLVRSVEQVAELYYLLPRLGVQAAQLFELAQDLPPAIIVCLDQNKQLLSAINQKLHGDQPAYLGGNLTQDIELLEQIARRLSPASLDLLDLAPECMSLILLVRYLKEAREQLLNILAALPGNVKH